MLRLESVFFFEDNKWIKKLKTKTIMIPPQHLVFSLQVQVFRRFYTNQIKDHKKTKFLTNK